MLLEYLVARITALPGPVRLVAVDGPGGAGKSTFAARMSAAADDAPVVHTDDFATPDDAVAWWPRLQSEVIEPLAHGRSARFRRFDWPSTSLGNWITIDPAPIVIIEGVSAGRIEWAEYLSFVIWIETPTGERLRRGLERDGKDALDQWRSWMAAEERHFLRDPVHRRADLVIDGSDRGQHA